MLSLSMHVINYTDEKKACAQEALTELCFPI